MTKEEQVSDICRPVIEGMGLEWVGVEYHHGRHATLRIYLDKEGGIAMDDVVAATEQLNPLLDVHDPIGGMYTLEVSSPGLDRPLFTLEHYKRFVGSLVKINVRVAVNKRRRFEGTLIAVDEETQKISIEFQVGKEKLVEHLALDNIEKGRLVPVFED
ncbi:MAG: ribosome maturation factor RimP [Cardiobacteriaceae bacterium]|nr:ribosome maturation factor RimP [Cardiobacteriaceae bacterium]